MSDDPIAQVNRFVVAVAALLVAFGALLIVLLAWAEPSASIDRLQDFVRYLRGHDNREGKVIVTLGAAVIVLLMLMTVIVEVTPPPAQRVRLRSVKSGEAAITTRQIAERINAEVGGVEHVAACGAAVTARGKRVEVVLDLQVDAGADLARTADEACRRAHVLVERQLGIDLAQPPRARLRYRELRLRREEPPQPPAPRAAPTGWERPVQPPEGDRDQRGQPDTPEEAQA